MTGRRLAATDDRRDRTRSRAWFLQVHYRWEAEGTSLGEALAATLQNRRVAERRVAYLERLADALEGNLSVVDATVQDALDNWRLERLSIIDRGLLRMGATEMLFFDDVPPKVSIQEAVRLAERYGGAESPRFVNGVLDALYKQSGVSS